MLLLYYPQNPIKSLMGQKVETPVMLQRSTCVTDSQLVGLSGTVDSFVPSD